MRSLLTSDRVRGFGWGFAGTVFALAFVWLGYHAYTDHRALHDMANYLNLKAPQINQLK